MTHTRNSSRALRVRRRLKAVSRLPRLSVFRSNAHFWAQVIDDAKGVTLTSAHDQNFSGTKTERAAQTGSLLAANALRLNIQKVVFDRGRFRFHGRVKAFAQAARQAGLQF